jgi:hypothetical protein
MNKQLVLLDEHKDSQDSKKDLKLNSDSERSHVSQRQTMLERNDIQVIPFQRDDRRVIEKKETMEVAVVNKIEKESTPVKLTKKQIAHTIIKKTVDSNSFIIFMTLLTLIALFCNDIQTAWLPVYVDDAFDILQTLLLFFFSLEILLTCIANREYINSFFFWLDVIATVSLIQDISFIFDPILNGGSRYLLLI